MKNPVLNGYTMLKTWNYFRRYPGLFSWQDAMAQWNRVVLPSRFHYRMGGKKLAEIAQIEQMEDGVYQVTLVHQKGLKFFWPSLPDNNLYFLIEQEFEPRNPHFYTTLPVRLQADSRILDVGACEGLFAFRVLQQGLASEVVCFEPGKVMAGLIERGARSNGCEDRLTVVSKAVSKESGSVFFEQGDGVEANGIVDPAKACAERSSLVQEVPAISIDDYCRDRGWELNSRDLIKIDAEGADLDALKGAEGMIRAGGPQIAVTTYHHSDHAEAMVSFLRSCQPAYQFRLKGFACWTPQPQPVLLQAALPEVADGA